MDIKDIEKVFEPQTRQKEVIDVQPYIPRYMRDEIEKDPVEKINKDIMEYSTMFFPTEIILESKR